ncbi:bifunctional phosphoribosyl-AMP cyclohydrolase/phosphoribosyl-ATP diphosphatase HisIE [Campylobacter sp. RM6883]|uniref:bifunctional phosphoribosyl-AMP cyclohydrolase/phosphoribosyl-ATP diphosphatase HisIE n=1 Tax=Campylobacter californiensis TaxID=1032243 RepID=UPI0014511651|nr:bifunctional phosphoribosyl-AMP cyclohydrolase/phosphoribosyl-ATP diphosphatase HisIE [Campylobacter sp. RM6914]MBE2984635.1 bifunctional phosphoribosyl-AMP cyclohydrolase/phosphoribosyl-ATP diphosphatase HisIE [Campylobacter sp. RM6883]MBE2995077.1 bifunctional phosphoribosyl-AMP cyclohydrolase/phosphoribosyl-ATP diphosphatase HisIE [Campylobacter sp. RM6913]QCD50106.1 phosphoribosyl-AMP cyclohydrolase / phosphoribosyl-ATP pyrophosphatase [Campylobacter sp. RM6914]
MLENLNIDWQKVDNLLPTIVQEQGSNDVLMLAYMNEEALNLSLKSGFAHYFSRTKNRIWKKGEESGNTQKIISAHLDCDNDTLLLKVVQNGGIACHTGQKSCFFNEINLTNLTSSNKPENVVNRPTYNLADELYHIILDRKLNADPQKSYVASLFHKGENSILKKIGEEATEFVMACKDTTANSSEKNKNDMVYEAADLYFHTMVALSIHNIHPDRIKTELARRFGMSGIDEKNSRNDK